MSAAREERESDDVRRQVLADVLWRAWHDRPELHNPITWRELCITAGLPEFAKHPATWIGDIDDWMIPRAMEDERIYTKLLLLFG